jgi:hypothetical protein
MPLQQNGLYALAILLCIPTQVAASEINQTTSYAKQNAYYCKLATNAGLKPAPVALDHFRLHNIHRGIADLYGDGTLEMVFGASDETFSLERAKGHYQQHWPAWVYEGNEARSRKAHQYAFYSPDREFKLPDGTRYLNARTILTQDFNGDGVDDLAFAIWGTDYEPYLPKRNEILLSSPEGYKAKYLPGSANFGHGASAGDLDNDGDIDLLVTGANNSFSRSPVYRYLNDSRGNFQISKLTNLPNTYVASLFDVDGDNNLDLFLSKLVNQTSTLQLYWGRGNGTFEDQPVSIFRDEWLSKAKAYKRGKNDTYIRYRHRSFSEPVFADTDNDGHLNIIIPSNMDLHFSLFDLELDGREVVSFNEVFRTPEAPNDGMLPELHWLNACDLGGKATDLVYEVFGQPFYGNSAPAALLDFSRADKIVFKNDGKGVFSFYKLENLLFFPTDTKSLLDGFANALGVTSDGYEPTQVYHPNTLDEAHRFLHRSYSNMRRGDQILPFDTLPEVSDRLGFSAVNGGNSAASSSSSTRTWNSEAQVSNRVRCLIAERKGQVESGCPSTQRDEAKSPQKTQPSNNNWNYGAVLSDSAKRILEKRQQKNVSY